MKKQYLAIITEIKKLILQNLSKNEILQKVCQILKEKIQHYDWVGFYLKSEEKPHELALAFFVGASTDHKNITFGKGICGQVAESEKTMIIQDVSRENNYLSCSINVKSEIVVPIFLEGKFIGELDIDSHIKSAFSKDDKELLEKIAKIISASFGKMIN